MPSQSARKKMGGVSDTETLEAMEQARDRGVLWDRSGSHLPVWWDGREKESVRLQVDWGKVAIC